MPDSALNFGHQSKGTHATSLTKQETGKGTDKRQKGREREREKRERERDKKKREGEREREKKKKQLKTHMVTTHTHTRNIRAFRERLEVSKKH